MGVHADQLVVVLGRDGGLEDVAERVSDEFGDGPVVTGPVVDGLGQAGESAAAALAGLRAAGAWPDAPRPVAADALLAERALDGDPLARAQLHDRVAVPLQAAGGEVLETVRAVLNSGGNLEASARAIFVHPNTVRYRLKRAADADRAVGHRPPRQLDPPGRPRTRAAGPGPLALALSRPVQGPAASLRAVGARSPSWSPPPNRPERGLRAGVFGGFLQRSPLCFRAAFRSPSGADHWHGEDVLAVLAPGQGAQKPGMLTDWLDLPGAESFFRWAGAIADADLLTLGTTGDAEAIKDTAVTQPLVVAMSLFIARELGGLPGPVSHTAARRSRRRHRRAQRRRAHRRGAGRGALGRGGHRARPPSAAGRWPPPARRRRPACPPSSAATPTRSSPPSTSTA